MFSYFLRDRYRSDIYSAEGVCNSHVAYWTLGWTYDLALMYMHSRIYVCNTHYVLNRNRTERILFFDKKTFIGHFEFKYNIRIWISSKKNMFD